MVNVLAQAARAGSLALILLLVLHLPLNVGTPRSGKVEWVVPRRDQAAGDLDAMAKLRGGAALLNCERYRQVSLLRACQCRSVSNSLVPPLRA
jgi:hypothetical protein